MILEKRRKIPTPKSIFLKMLEKVREEANCNSNGFKKKDWLDIVRGFNQQANCDYGKQQHPQRTPGQWTYVEGAGQGGSTAG